MRREINPLPIIVEKEAEAHDGDFLDGLVFDIHASTSKNNSLEEIGADNFRAKPEKEKTEPITSKPEER